MACCRRCRPGEEKSRRQIEQVETIVVVKLREAGSASCRIISIYT